ncbi:MAG: invasion associated locus B family protein [Pseudomonadota bacterium]
MKSIRQITATAALGLTLSLAAPLTAQAQSTEGEATEGLSMGQTLVDGRVVGEEYVGDTFQDWAHRCVTTADGTDPCNAYQLLVDSEGNSVAEISLVPISNGGQAVAGGTIVTPLETLLLQQVTLRIDAGAERRYPFSFCTRQGCISRVGFTQADIDAMKRGAGATLSIVPAGAPDQPVVLDVSLTGFTAAYDALAPR